MTIGNSAEIQSGICSWSIVDGVLAYRSESGSIHNPTSIEIWKAQFSTNKKFGLKPSDCLTGIAFSRFPAELTLNITGSPADTLSIAITARMGISSSPFPDYLPDQIIMDSVWFPVSVSDYLDTISALGNMLIPLHGTITMGQYIWLKSRKDFGMTIVDR
ncbi:MAG: hypothetical protein Q8O15_10590, partial [Rectinemataceae bacterium]|nr:hypothetical protein [Rectinemataceae bacterium]